MLFPFSKMADAKKTKLHDFGEDKWHKAHKAIVEEFRDFVCSLQDKLDDRDLTKLLVLFNDFERSRERETGYLRNEMDRLQLLIFQLQEQVQQKTPK